MSANVDPPGGTATPTPPTTQPTPAAEPASQSTDAGISAGERAELDRLRGYYNQAEADYAFLGPIRDDVIRLGRDEKARQFYRDALKSYDQLQADQDKTPAEMRPLLDSVHKIEERMDKRDQSEQYAQQAALQERGKKEWETVYKLGAANPWLAKENYRAVPEIVAWANSNGMGNSDFSTVFDAYTSEMHDRFGSGQAQPPPRSLRADAGVPGVPGPRGPGPIKSQADIRDRIRAGLRNQRAG